jgi:hypothetical protein
MSCAALSGACAVALGASISVLAMSEAGAHQQTRTRNSPPAGAARPATRLAKPEGPLQIVVSTGSQKLFVYDRDRLIETSKISTGTPDFPTPTGVFAILDKNVVHYSNIYGGASMPYMQRLTMSGVALHSGHVTGRPASHGCIRLPHAFAVQLFAMTKLGGRVIIAANEPAPVDIEHERLFSRIPAPTPPSPKTAHGTSALETASDLDKGAGYVKVGPITAAHALELDKLPVSAFVSRAEGKVFIRHGFRPLYEAPVVIRDADRPFGTHVFTAAEINGEGRVRWLVTSVPSEPGVAPADMTRRERMASRSMVQPISSMAPRPNGTASQALDRIELPQEAIDLVSQMLKVGSSLIVSDQGLSRELRAFGTDFIVLTR